MRIIVIGAGGVGSAAARFLAREGHAVTVLERTPEA
ncbi:MAG: FAD-dependent oxidoreductase, partial [Armatimonadetes bacterium]|nr:FAD-dependent oxidoreductase [Armatimonadota bacterium]